MATNQTNRSEYVLIQLSKSTKGAIACAAITLGLAACASTPVPNEKIAVAKASVQRAEQSGAPELAPVEMAAARDKLARAEKAAASNNEQPATQLAEQANVDAELAEATARQQRSHKAAMEFDTSMQALRSESMRNSQPTQ
jgi:glutathione synthase/RimK-type ligase-like ATP-grasp enzyme